MSPCDSSPSHSPAVATVIPAGGHPTPLCKTCIAAYLADTRQPSTPFRLVAA